MIRSLLLYMRYITGTLLSDNRPVLFHEAGRPWVVPKIHKIEEYPKEEFGNALPKAIRWLLRATERMNDDGFGSFHLRSGWTTSYPETSGYIIPTLLKYGIKYSEKEPVNAARRTADWLISIQKPSGGWQGMRMADNKPEVVFNTGQVIRGMNAAFRHFGDEKYLESAKKAADWLCKVQEDNGSWKKHALMEEERVYDSFVSAPLIETYRLSGEEKYRDAAVRNLDWILNEKQLRNGWFEDCDNTVKHNDRPILHTISYTIDGLIDAGEMLGRDDYFEAGKKAAENLLKSFFSGGRMWGRYDREWKGSEHFICTGGAQIAIIWLKIYGRTLEECYLEAAGRMIDLLIFIQDRKNADNDNTLGAVPGSFPVWGKYEPFAFPNWATKFFADALMLIHGTGYEGENGS